MEEQTTQGIDLSVFLHNFRRTLQHFFWVPIVLGLLLGGVSWLRAARSYAPVYQSSAVFSVSAGFSSSTDILSHSTYLDSNAAAQLSATFPYVLQSDRMQLLLQQELGDQRAPVSLSASSVADAALFTLTATGSDPQAVYDTLLAAIEVYPAAATTILGDTQIQVIDQPVEPSAAPINANTALQTGIRRGVVGLVLGLVLVALLSLTRRTVHSAEDLHRLISLSCLSSIPAVRRGKRTRREAPSLLLTHAGTGSDFSEAMRNLSLKLQRITSKHGAKVVLITSTVPGEGKTTVASNLALALAAEGKRVILIDGDLRKQSLKPLFGIGAHSDGLVEVLSGKAKNFRLLPVPDSGLLLLSGDGTVAQPQRLLGSPRMGQIFGAAAAEARLHSHRYAACRRSVRRCSAGQICRRRYLRRAAGYGKLRPDRQLRPVALRRRAAVWLRAELHAGRNDALGLSLWLPLRLSVRLQQLQPL